MPIKRAADVYWGEGRRWGAEAIIDLVREKGIDIPEPESGTAGTPVIAYINHGRWLADCGLFDAAKDRNCANAQLVDEHDPRFFCVACLNDEIGGQWREVTWPEEPTLVEEPLEELLIVEQNWVPEE